MISILIVDDQPSVLRGLRMRLAAEADLEVVGEARSGEEAVAAAGELRPDVVVIDLVMPGIDGITATQKIVTAGLAAVVVMSLHDDKANRARALAAGAVLFVAKHEADATLTTAIRTAAVARAKATAQQVDPR